MSPKKKLPSTTKRVLVQDTTGRKRKGKEFNITVRVDAATSERLEMFQGVRSRNAVISKVLDEFLDVVADLDWTEIQREGKQRGKHPAERTSMWQARVPDVVKRVKMLEQSVKVSRSIIGRAAVRWFLNKYEKKVPAWLAANNMLEADEAS